jgi:hypothetical protein
LPDVLAQSDNANQSHSQDQAPFYRAIQEEMREMLSIPQQHPNPRSNEAFDYIFRRILNRHTCSVSQ